MTIQCVHLPRMRRGNAFGHICCVSVCLCLSVCNALTVENFGLESSFLVNRYIIKISRSSSYIKVTGSRSRSQEKNNVSVSMLFACCLSSIEGQSCTVSVLVFYKCILLLLLLLFGATVQAQGAAIQSSSAVARIRNVNRICSSVMAIRIAAMEPTRRSAVCH